MYPRGSYDRLDEKMVVTKKAKLQVIMSRAEAVGWAKAARRSLNAVDDRASDRISEVLGGIECRLRELIK
jgi:hypothetical protein